MALLDNFRRGESLSIAFTLPESYDTARIQDLEVVVGSKVYTHTLVDHLITVQLTSVDTAKLSGYQTITVMIDDSQLGVQKIDCGTVNALSTYSRYTSDSVNSGNNILITLTVSETIITSSSVYYNIFRVKSVYELAVEEGYTGTEEEYMALLNSVWDVRPYVDFDVDTESMPDVARLMWDAANNTLQFGVPDGGFIQIGQEPHDYYTNLSGVPIVNGDIVSVYGASGNRTAVKLTDATDDALALATFGMVTVNSIGNNNAGRITKSGGKVRGLNTNAYTEGTVIYVDPANPGKWTATKPEAPNRAVQIGIVSVKSATVGVVELFIKTYPKLSELADVDGTAATIAEDDKMLIRTVDDGLVKEITKANFVAALKSDFIYPADVTDVTEYTEITI